MFVTLIGAVDFLSYITSGGYLFVLFCSNLSMITLRKKYPFIHRPFKVPAFPLTPILASLVCLIVLRYSEVRALVFMGGVLGIFALYYYIKLGVESWQAEHKRSQDPGRYRLVVPMQHASGLDNVVRLGARIANADNEMNMCLLQVVDKQATEDEQAHEKLLRSRQYTLEKFIKFAVERNVPMYSKTVSGTSTAEGIIDEMRGDNNVRLILFKWPVSEENQVEFGESLDAIIRSGLTNIGVLFDRGIDRIENILVPVGGGLHSKLAIFLAENLAQADNATIDFMRVVDQDLDDELYEDQMAFLQEVVMTELGNIPGNANLHIIRGEDPASAIVAEAQDRDYDLIIIGSFEGQAKPGLPFGEVVDKVVKGSNASVLVLRQHQSPAASWLRQQLKASNKRS